MLGKMPQIVDGNGLQIEGEALTKGLDGNKAEGKK